MLSLEAVGKGKIFVHNLSGKALNETFIDICNLVYYVLFYYDS